MFLTEGPDTLFKIGIALLKMSRTGRTLRSLLAFYSPLASGERLSEAYKNEIPEVLESLRSRSGAKLGRILKVKHSSSSNNREVILKQEIYCIPKLFDLFPPSDLLSQDFEGMLKYFRVSLPRRYMEQKQGTKLLSTAHGVKVNPGMQSEVSAKLSFYRDLPDN